MEPGLRSSAGITKAIAAQLVELHGLGTRQAVPAAHRRRPVNVLVVTVYESDLERGIPSHPAL